jgi:hypothetical protein
MQTTIKFNKFLDKDEDNLLTVSLFFEKSDTDPAFIYSVVKDSRDFKIEYVKDGLLDFNSSDIIRFTSFYKASDKTFTVTFSDEKDDEVESNWFQDLKESLGGDFNESDAIKLMDDMLESGGITKEVYDEAIAVLGRREMTSLEKLQEMFNDPKLGRILVTDKTIKIELPPEAIKTLTVGEIDEFFDNLPSVAKTA